jgi:RNA polymerase-binding transcription factor DksA
MASKKAPKKIKKAVAKKTVKPVAKKVAPKKPAKAAAPAARKPVRTAKPVAVAKPAKVAKKAKPVVEEAEQEIKIKPVMNAKELAFHKDLLLKLRDRVIDEMNFLAKDNLNRSGKDGAGDLSSYSFHMADQGTDNFDREFAANLLSGEQDVLYEIEEALRRVEAGTYGVCEMSGLPIERERLKVLPYARYSVAIQSQMEKGKPRFRPFKRTSIQQGVSGEM